jgi:hypothetical protein
MDESRRPRQSPLVESAKVCGIDPIAYLIECATRAKRTPGTVLLPADFKADLAQ